METIVTNTGTYTVIVRPLEGTDDRIAKVWDIQSRWLEFRVSADQMTLWDYRGFSRYEMDAAQPRFRIAADKYLAA